MTENSSSKTKSFWTALIVIVICIPIFLAILFGLGQSSGTEFSPDDFSRRSFSYNQTPYFDWVLIKKTYSDVTTPLEESMVIDGFIQPVINKTKTWHLISDSGSGADFMSAACDARFLTDYLDLIDDQGDDYWQIWNGKFPGSAKVFWPRVVDLARDEMYLKIPDIMQFAMELETDDAQELTSGLDTVIAAAYFELGQIDLELKRFPRAEVRLQRSLETMFSQEAKQLLAECQAKLESSLETNLKSPSESHE